MITEDHGFTSTMRKEKEREVKTSENTLFASQQKSAQESSKNQDHAHYIFFLCLRSDPSQICFKRSNS